MLWSGDAVRFDVHFAVRSAAAGKFAICAGIFPERAGISSERADIPPKRAGIPPKRAGIALKQSPLLSPTIKKSSRWLLTRQSEALSHHLQ